MSDVVTDTHGIIWYLEDSPKLSTEANKIFNACDRGELFIYVPTICLVEMVYLAEKGRIPLHLQNKLESELQEGNSGLVVADLTLDIVKRLPDIPRSAIPDMLDRIIAATALQLGLPLISRDRKIQLSDINIIW